MATAYNPSIVTSGLRLYLDAANVKSYGPVSVEALVVAGGGAGGGYGGNDGSGGGGAGGLLYSSALFVTPGTAYTITVGAGGTGVGGATRGNSGGNSTFSTLTAIGGGGGGSEGATDQRPGAAGGSGGGAGGYGSNPGGTGVAGQGNNGGACTAPGDGGGGGAGAVGQSGTTGIGGIGLQYDISGTLTYYAGGGGASGDKRNGRGAGGGVGGLGGGGKGQDASASSVPVAGTPNTGGGGGAAAGSTPTYGAGTTLTSGAGGSGVVIIRYPGSQKATGGTITSSRGYTIHTFTTSGTFTLGINWGDLSKNLTTGTLTNGPVYDGANGGSIVFDGVNDKVTFPFTVATGARSFFVWVKYNSLTHPSGYQLMGTQEVNAYTYIGIENGGGVYYYAGASTGGNVGNAVTAGVWVNLGVVLNSDGSRVIYKDGVAIHTNTGGIGAAATAPFTLGAINDNHWVNGSVSVASLYERALSAAEVQQNYNALRGRYTGIGMSPSTPAISAAEIKANNPTVQSGVYWLYSTGINSGTPFQCYCDFTMDGGIGYAIYFQQYFNSTDDGGTTGYEYGPTFTSMTSSAITGTPGYSNEFNIYPNLMPIQYNNGAGATRMIVYNKTNTGISSSGIQGATNYKWTRLSGITPTNMRDIWTAYASTGQYTASYVSAGNSGRTAGSGTAYIQGAHGSGGGVYQWVSGASGNVNDYLIFEYKPNANPADPNHYWMVDTGVAGSVYFRANSEYGASGVFQTRYGGIAIY